MRRSTCAQWARSLLLSSTIACGGAAAEGDGSTGDTGSGTSDGSASNAGSETSASSVADDGDDDTGEPPEPEPELDPWSPAAVGPVDFRLGPLHTVHEPVAGFDFGSFPFAVSAPRTDGVAGTRAMVSFSESPDASDAVIVTRMMATTDLGASYQTIEDNAALENAAVLEDQSLLGVGFVPVWGSGDHSATLTLARSTDGGLSWGEGTATFFGGDENGQIRGLRFHRGLLEVGAGPDAGTLLVPWYGHLGPGPVADIGSVELAASTDHGATWTRWGTMVPARHPSDPDETTVEYAADGTMIAVTRNVVFDGAGASSQGPLLVGRSDDDGRTWSAPEPILISFDGAPAAPKAAVDPHLHRLPSGVLLLAAGRPDNWVAVSHDDGQSWTDAAITYVNYPENGSRLHGSSGYQALAAVASHRAMLFGDNCANSWGCPAGDSGWVVDGEYRIWGRTLDVVPTDPGRVDLLGAFAAGDVTVTTDLVADQDALGSASLFDGSLAPGARLTGTGETLIEFGSPQLVTRLALATAPGSAVARVLLFDGASWIDPQIESGDGGDRSLRAFEPPAPRPVQSIRITFEAGRGQGVLSELEIFTTTNSFENETLGQPPRAAAAAAADATMATVERLDPEAPAQAIRLHDTADDAIARIAFVLPEGASSASLRLRATALPGGLLFGLGSADGPLLHLTIDGEGAIRRYDADAAAWMPVAPAGTVDPLAWMHITLGTDGSLRVDGMDIDLGAPIPGTATPETLYVTSTGTVPVGVDLWIDDVAFAVP